MYVAYFCATLAAAKSHEFDQKFCGRTFNKPVTAGMTNCPTEWMTDGEIELDLRGGSRPKYFHNDLYI